MPAQAKCKHFHSKTTERRRNLIILTCDQNTNLSRQENTASRLLCKLFKTSQYGSFISLIFNLKSLPCLEKTETLNNLRLHYLTRMSSSLGYTQKKKNANLQNFESEMSEPSSCVRKKDAKCTSTTMPSYTALPRSLPTYSNRAI